MQIILLENVDKIGRRGEIVSVSKGYARNYLIPSGLATYVTADNLRRAEILKKKYVQEEMERLGALKEMAAKLSTVSITIHAKASEEGNLFGSVGSSQILEALKEQGFELEPRTVKLEENIRRVGVYSIPVQLHSDIQADVKLWVVEEEQEEKESQEEESREE